MQTPVSELPSQAGSHGAGTPEPPGPHGQESINKLAFSAHNGSPTAPEHGNVTRGWYCNDRAVTLQRGRSWQWGLSTLWTQVSGFLRVADVGSEGNLLVSWSQGVTPQNNSGVGLFSQSPRLESTFHPCVMLPCCVSTITILNASSTL